MSIVFEDVLGAAKTKYKYEHRCPACNKKLSTSKAFCSEKCKLNYYDYLKIEMSPKFIKSVQLFEYSYENKIQRIKKMADYHKFNFEMTMKKFNEQSIALGYEILTKNVA